MEAALPEFITLLMPHGWSDLSLQHNLRQLESDVIPAFLSRQRWFGAKDQRVKAAQVQAHGEIARPAEDASVQETHLVGVGAAKLGQEIRHGHCLPLANIPSAAR